MRKEIKIKLKMAGSYRPFLKSVLITECYFPTWKSLLIIPADVRMTM